MATLADKLPKLYAELHGRQAFQGVACKDYLAEFEAFVRSHAGTTRRTVLDFGCGPFGGISSLTGHDVLPYDPYVPQFQRDPWADGATVFFSADVFEHLPEAELFQVVRRLCESSTLSLVFLAISTRHANKSFSNGVNVHLTVRTPDWWMGFLVGSLGLHFNLEAARADRVADTVIFEFARKVST